MRDGLFGGRGKTPGPEGAVMLLRSPRFEIMPFDSFTDQVAHLPSDSAVTITTSPTLGLEATISKAEAAAEMGYEVIPHIAARYVQDEAHVEDIVHRLRAVGITDIFVPGGDREEPIGDFDSAYSLLSTLAELDYPFGDIGITGYPEGHPFLTDRVLADAMQEKLPYATYIATQLCYDPADIIAWIDTIRQRGIDLPVHVGIPGVVNYQRLLNISRRVGVGDSIRFLQKTTGVLGFVRHLIGSRGTYTPDRIIDGLAPYADDPVYNIHGVHIYTFNQVPDTESWRRGRLEHL